MIDSVKFRITQIARRVAWPGFLLGLSVFGALQYAGIGAGTPLFGLLAVGAAAVGELLEIWPPILAIEIVRYLLAAGAVALVITMFWRFGLARRKIQVRSATKEDIRREIVASLRTGLVFSLFGLMLYDLATSGWVTIYTDFSRRGWGYLIATLALMIVAQDTYFYWLHRALHHRLLFRRCHATHHKSHTPTAWAAYAFDWFEAAANACFVLLFVAAVPVHQLTLFLFMAHQVVRNAIGHAGVELYPAAMARSRLFGWINSTTHHDLHHQHGRYNYGLYFTWWDRLMGTEHPHYLAHFDTAAHPLPPTDSAMPPIDSAIGRSAPSVSQP